MDDTAELSERFERYCDTKDNDVPSDVLNELQSIQRIFSISAEELDFKWQAYNIKMGGEENKLDLKTARDFKKNLQNELEKETRGKAQQRPDGKRAAPAPRPAKGGDMFDMLDGMITTPRAAALGSAAKRRSNFDTPASKAHKNSEMSSPAGGMTPRGEATGPSVRPRRLVMQSNNAQRFQLLLPHQRR